LGPTHSATATKIKRANRNHACAHHPGLHRDDAKAKARFNDISAACDLAKYPVSRAQFDTGVINAICCPAGE
jgi:DnaJ-class molecular chaperone